MKISFLCSLVIAVLFTYLLRYNCLNAEDLQSISGPKEVEIPDKRSKSEQDVSTSEDSEKIILNELKGITLLGSLSLVENNQNSMEWGIVLKELQVPGKNIQLSARLRPFLNNPLTQKAISQIKRQIILYYREQHHPVVMVFVPEQKITDGVLQLVVIESRVGKVNVRDVKYTRKDRIQRWIRLEPGETINEKKLLQDVSWINMDPFRSANIIYAPGDKNGTTDVDIQVNDRRPWRLYTGGDNTGSEYIGNARWFAGINLENALFPDNLLSYQYTSSSDFHKFKSHTMQYIAPFSWRHMLSIFGGYASVHPNIPSFNTHGKSYQASARYDAPLWFTYPSIPQQLTIGFDFKGTNNNLIFGEDNSEVIQNSLVNLTQFVFGYHLSFDKWNQKIGAGIEVFWSPGQLVPHASKSDYESLNPEARPNYVYGRLVYTHELILPKRWTLNGQFRLQLSNSNLIASEQFALGGYNTVRGYPERVVNGDNAVCANFEVHTPSYQAFNYFFRNFPRDALFFLAFFDFGHAWDHKKVPSLPKEQTLLSIGPGLRYRVSSYFNARFDVGFPLHKIAEASSKPRCHASAVLSY